MEATIVTSTFLPQLVQDAHHLDEAIVTTTLSPATSLTSFLTERGEGVTMETPPSPR